MWGTGRKLLEKRPEQDELSRVKVGAEPVCFSPARVAWPRQLEAEITSYYTYHYWNELKFTSVVPGPSLRVMVNPHINWTGFIPVETHLECPRECLWVGLTVGWRLNLNVGSRNS